MIRIVVDLQVKFIWSLHGENRVFSPFNLYSTSYNHYSFLPNRRHYFNIIGLCNNEVIFSDDYSGFQSKFALVSLLTALVLI